MLFQNYDAILYKKTENIVHSRCDILGKLVGFSPSAGAVVVSRTSSAVFVDGRYTLAADEAVDKTRFEILDFNKTDIFNWIKRNFEVGSIIAYDENFFSIEEIDYLKKELSDYKLVSIDLRQELSLGSGISRLRLINVPYDNEIDRFACVYQAISEHSLDAYLVSDYCSVVWLLGLRNLNEQFVPAFPGYLLITKQHEILLFTDDVYPANLMAQKVSELQRYLSKLGRVGIDKSLTSAKVDHRSLVHVENPCTISQLIKDKVEIKNIEEAAAKDSVALINFLHWIHNCAENVSELDAVEKVHYFRALQPSFIGESFATIAAADENAAVVHYAPTVSSNKIIQNILLLDSGGQYKYGTTDITRTIALRAPTSREKLIYTLVLKGHIAVASAKFPRGTTGAQLDSLARQFLWQYQCDYAHSTGHGIGYMLHVHEGPLGISRNNNVPLQCGMLLSNEPGYYKANHFGVRLENMMFVENISDDFLCFNTISLVPFDMSLVDMSMLSAAESRWLKQYHERILSTLNLDSNVRNWVRHQTDL